MKSLTVVLANHPEARFTPSGKLLGIFETFGLDGLRLEAWDDIADELVSSNLGLGNVIQVHGYEKTSRWRDRDGIEHKQPTFVVKSWKRVS